jgi:hypothetical protein
MFEALDKAFRAALLLTGSTAAAEIAVLEGIAALDADHISGGSLLLETVKSATERHADIPDEFREDFSILPLELQRVLLLAPNLRHCFVLRVLLGMPLETCSGILHLPVDEVESALCRATRELPHVAGRGSVRRDFIRAARRNTDESMLSRLRSSAFRASGQESLILYDRE